MDTLTYEQRLNELGVTRGNLAINARIPCEQATAKGHEKAQAFKELGERALNIEVDRNDYSHLNPAYGRKCQASGKMGGRSAAKRRETPA